MVAARQRLATFQQKLASLTVLDPACGSGNFLYVSLQLLLGLEKEVITFATLLGFRFESEVGARRRAPQAAGTTPLKTLPPRGMDNRN